MTIKERLYHKAIEETVKKSYNIDRYGLACCECNSYVASGQVMKHDKGCFIIQLERILTI